MSTAIAVALIHGTSYGAITVQNGSFEDQGPTGSVAYNVPVPPGPGNSAANNWTTFFNSPGSIDTQVQAYAGGGGVPPLPPPPSIQDPGELYLRVEVAGAGNGMVQVLGPLNTGPDFAMVSAWIYVESGQVGVGIGNGGNTSLTAFSQGVGQWEFISTTNLGTQSPANEIIFYNNGPSTQFYLDLVSVKAVPEPSSMALLMTGATGLVGGLYRRRKRMTV